MGAVFRGKFQYCVACRAVGGYSEVDRFAEVHRVVCDIYFNGLSELVGSSAFLCESDALNVARVGDSGHNPLRMF